MSVGKRLRFEVLKRDGFRCRYCGATALASALHVDHVIAVASGGTDDHQNLVTACVGCNAGKSDVPLDASRLAPSDPLELAREHVEQIRAYLDAQREVDAERSRVVAYVEERWREIVGFDSPVSIKWRTVLAEHPLSRVIESIEAVASNAWKLASESAETRFFYGCLRRRRGDE